MVQFAEHLSKPLSRNLSHHLRTMADGFFLIWFSSCQVDAKWRWGHTSYFRHLRSNLGTGILPLLRHKMSHIGKTLHVNITLAALASKRPQSFTGNAMVSSAPHGTPHERMTTQPFVWIHNAVDTMNIHEHTVTVKEQDITRYTIPTIPVTAQCL